MNGLISTKTIFDQTDYPRLGLLARLGIVPEADASLHYIFAGEQEEAFKNRGSNQDITGPTSIIGDVDNITFEADGTIVTGSDGPAFDQMRLGTTHILVFDWEAQDEDNGLPHTYFGSGARTAGRFELFRTNLVNSEVDNALLTAQNSDNMLSGSFLTKPNAGTVFVSVGIDETGANSRIWTPGVAALERVGNFAPTTNALRIGGAGGSPFKIKEYMRFDSYLTVNNLSNAYQRAAVRQSKLGNTIDSQP